MKKLKLTELNSQKLNERKMGAVTGGMEMRPVCNWGNNGVSASIGGWGEANLCGSDCEGGVTKATMYQAALQTTYYF